MSFVTSLENALYALPKRILLLVPFGVGPLFMQSSFRSAFLDAQMRGLVFFLLPFFLWKMLRVLVERDLASGSKTSSSRKKKAPVTAQDILHYLLLAAVSAAFLASLPSFKDTFGEEPFLLFLGTLASLAVSDTFYRKGWMLPATFLFLASSWATGLLSFLSVTINLPWQGALVSLGPACFVTAGVLGEKAAENSRPTSSVRKALSLLILLAPFALSPLIYLHQLRPQYALVFGSYLVTYRLLSQIQSDTITQKTAATIALAGLTYVVILALLTVTYA